MSLALSYHVLSALLSWTPLGGPSSPLLIQRLQCLQNCAPTLKIHAASASEQPPPYHQQQQQQLQQQQLQQQKLSLLQQLLSDLFRYDCDFDMTPSTLEVLTTPRLPTLHNLTCTLLLTYTLVYLLSHPFTPSDTLLSRLLTPTHTPSTPSLIPLPYPPPPSSPGTAHTHTPSTLFAHHLSYPLYPPLLPHPLPPPLPPLPPPLPLHPQVLPFAFQLQLKEKAAAVMAHLCCNCGTTLTSDGTLIEGTRDTNSHPNPYPNPCPNPCPYPNPNP